MPNSLFELLSLIEAQKKYNCIANGKVNEENRKFYQELSNSVSNLINKSMNTIGVSIEDLNSFYDEIKAYFSDKEPTIEKDSTISKMIASFQSFDELPYNSEKTKNYYNLITSNPLFKRIMVQKTLEQKIEMENILGTTFSFMNTGDDIYKLVEVIQGYKDKLVGLLATQKITQQQYNNYLKNIDYLTNYYWSVVKGEQENYNQTLRRSLTEQKSN